MTAHELWMRAAPDEHAKLAKEDPDHLKMLEDGWSWVDLRGGPKDGSRVYHVGPPKWELYYIDPSIDPDKYKPGDLEHRYVLSCYDGDAVYVWAGELRRKKEKP